MEPQYLQGGAHSVELMELQIWHPPASSVTVWLHGERAQKRENGLCLPFHWEKAVLQLSFDARYFTFSQYATAAFQAATLVLDLRGSESE